MTDLRLVAFSDLHIGSYQSAVDENGLNLGMKSNDKVRAFIVDYCRKIQPDLIVFVGDLYRSAIGKPSQGEQWRAAEFFTELSLIAPIVAKEGNHDIGEGKDVSALQIFGKMGIRMTVLPVPDKWSVINVEGIRIGLYHGMLANVKLESGMMSDLIKAEGLTSIKEAPNADLYLLGDIHHRQFLASNAVYCGSPDRLNFGEEKEQPSIWDVTIKKIGDKVDIDWQAISTPARKYVTIKTEAEAATVDVQDAVVRFEGALSKLTHGELVSLLKSRGAAELTNVADTSEFEEVLSLYTSFDPVESFTIWLDAQTNPKEEKALAQQRLMELVQ